MSGQYYYYDDFRYDRLSLVMAGMLAVPELIAGVVMSRNVGILTAEGADLYEKLMVITQGILEANGTAVTVV